MLLLVTVNVYATCPPAAAELGALPVIVRLVVRGMAPVFIGADVDGVADDAGVATLVGAGQSRSTAVAFVDGRIGRPIHNSRATVCRWSARFYAEDRATTLMDSNPVFPSWSSLLV